MFTINGKNVIYFYFALNCTHVIMERGTSSDGGKKKQQRKQEQNQKN